MTPQDNIDELLTELRSGLINFDDKAKALITQYTQRKVLEALEDIENAVQDIATSKPTVAYATSIPTNKVLYTLQQLKSQLTANQTKDNSNE